MVDVISHYALLYSVLLCGSQVFIKNGDFMLGLIGAFFSVIVNFLMILLAYFDEQRGVFELYLLRC
jgi:uncharacterized membrane protein YgaE (UPF0421/DUF939 family)